jgi:uncharacterized protein
LILKGCYPPIYDQDIAPKDWFPNYIRTYIDRDVRQLKNISNLRLFERFVRVLAGRTGQELNANSVSIEIGVDVKTIQSWMGILESSFIIHLLKPHFNNFNKTIVKRPKIYFYDTGLVCALIGIQNTKQLALHPLRGHLFENMVVNELLKHRTNLGLPINLFYWRDKTGHEIDIIVDRAGELLPIEIKSGQTSTSDYFKNIQYWRNLSQAKQGLVLYAGAQQQKRSDGNQILNWRVLVKESI